MLDICNILSMHIYISIGLVHRLDGLINAPTEGLNKTREKSERGDNRAGLG